MKKSSYLDDSRQSIDWVPQSIDWDHSHRRAAAYCGQDGDDGAAGDAPWLGCCCCHGPGFTPGRWGGSPCVPRAGGDAGSEGGRAVLVRSLHASMRSSCPSCPLLAHSRPRSSRTYGWIRSPPRSSAPNTVWRAAVRWLEKWPQNKKDNIVLCVPPSQVWRQWPVDFNTPDR